MSKAITPFRASDLQHLLDLAEHRRNGGLTRVGSVPRGVLEILREMTEIFEGAHLDFALADALALSFYAPARETADIAFVCLDSQREDIKNALQEAGFRVVQGNLPYQMTFKDPRSKIEIHILLGAVDPEESAASDPIKANFLGVPTLVIKPEYLLWMYCLSDRTQHRTDCIALLNTGKVNVSKLRQYLKHAQDTTAERRLNVLVLLSKREAANEGYSASVVRRVKAHRDTKK
jgi:hypothetical protein